MTNNRPRTINHDFAAAIERIKILQRQQAELAQAATDVLDDHFWPRSISDSESVIRLRELIETIDE